VKFLDDVGDRGQIGFGGKNQQRIDAFVGDDLGVAQHENVPGPAGGRPVDDLLQAILEPAASAGAARPAPQADLQPLLLIEGIGIVWVVTGLARQSSRSSQPATQAATQAPNTSAQPPSLTLPAHRRGLTAALSQVAQNRGDVPSQGILDWNDDRLEV